MPRVSGAAAVARRVEILSLRAAYPDASLNALARMMVPPVAKATVQSVLKRYSDEDQEVVMQPRNDNGRSRHRLKRRWKRYVHLCTVLVYRVLHLYHLQATREGVPEEPRVVTKETGWAHEGVGAEGSCSTSGRSRVPSA